MMTYPGEFESDRYKVTYQLRFGYWVECKSCGVSECVGFREEATKDWIHEHEIDQHRVG